MKRIAILARSFFRFEEDLIALGGIETYLQELYSALSKDYDVVIFQNGHQNRSIQFNGISIVEIECRTAKQLVDKVASTFIRSDDIIIFSTEQWSAKTLHKKTIVIQHGIYWDLPIKYYTKHILARVAPTVFKIFDGYRNYWKIKSFTHIVCVDYIYPTWYKTLFPQKETKFHVIPNFSAFPSDPAILFGSKSLKAENAQINILFARRFVEMRGVRLAIDIAEYLLAKFSQVHFTFAGEGPLLHLIKERLGKHKRVNITRANHSEIEGIIASSDIVLIPSLGSEGTSLIAIESMALGKTIVASQIGGLTNIVIDGFNGFLCAPTQEDFCNLLSTVIENPTIRDTLKSNAVLVASQALSRDVWRKRWSHVLNAL